jgi:hypothetical protein
MPDFLCCESSRWPFAPPFRANGARFFPGKSQYWLENASLDLIEVASILELRRGRAVLRVAVERGVARMTGLTFDGASVPRVSVTSSVGKLCAL